MQHVAIIRGEGIINTILEGKKTIESRWYVNKISPWNRIKIGEEIFFKESGGPVIARATVTKIIQYENINFKLVEKILARYGKNIFPEINEIEMQKWKKDLTKKRYCILMFLKKVKRLKPFYIDKRGFGYSCAWMTVDKVANVIY